MNAIRARDFPGFKGEYNLPDFYGIWDRVKEKMIFRVKEPSSGGVSLKPKVRILVVSGVEGVIESENVILDSFRAIGLIPIIIL